MRLGILIFSAAMLSANNVYAEIYTRITGIQLNGTATDLPTGLMQHTHMGVNCVYCGPYKAVLHEYFLRRGYRILEKQGSAGYVFATSISIPGESETIRMDADDAHNHAKKLIPPADKTRAFAKSETSGARSILDMDAGLVARGTELTSSGGGGLLIGLLCSVFGSVIDKKAMAKATQMVPGVVTTIVEIRRESELYQITAKTVADTPETTDTLLRASFDHVVDLLVNGGQSKGGIDHAEDGGMAWK